jgi:hypothetical protein
VLGLPRCVQVKEFKELFDSLDHDGGGHIDVDELAGAQSSRPPANVACVCLMHKLGMRSCVWASKTTHTGSTCHAPKTL